MIPTENFMKENLSVNCTGLIWAKITRDTLVIIKKQKNVWQGKPKQMNGLLGGNYYVLFKMWSTSYGRNFILYAMRNFIAK